MDTVRRLNRSTGNWETWPQVRCPHKRLKGEVCGELYGLSLARDSEPTHYSCNRCHRKYSLRDVKILERHQVVQQPGLTIVRGSPGEQLELPLEGES